MSELNLDAHGTLHSVNETEEVPLFRFAAVLSHAAIDAPTDPLLEPLKVDPVSETPNLKTTQEKQQIENISDNEICIADKLEARDENAERSKTNALKKQILTGISVVLIFAIGVGAGRLFSQPHQNAQLPAIVLTPFPRSASPATFAPTNRSLAKLAPRVSARRRGVIQKVKSVVNNIATDRDKKTAAPNAVVQPGLAVVTLHLPKSDVPPHVTSVQTPEASDAKRASTVTTHVPDISRTTRHDAVATATRKTLFKPRLTLPIIARFDIRPSVIPMGSDATLCILVRNAVSVRVSEIGKVPPGYFACRTIAPWRTTTYTVIANGYGGFSAATSATVRVMPRIYFR